MSHTPGPWDWDGNVCNYDSKNEAPWLVGTGNDVVLTGTIECKSEANARLIAAAPDLLAALEAINPVPGEYYYDGSSDLPGYELMRDDVSTIRAAIAKARGE